MDNYLNIQDKRLSSYSAEEVVRLLQAQIGEVLAFSAVTARRTGLGTSEMAALEHLHNESGGGDDGGGLTPTQLGRRLAMSSGTITALVDRLERGGYVERHPNPKDRRSSVVRITPSGMELGARYLGPLAAELLEATGGLSERDRVVVGSYLDAVTGIIARHARG